MYTDTDKWTYNVLQLLADVGDTRQITLDQLVLSTINRGGLFDKDHWNECFHLLEEMIAEGSLSEVVCNLERPGYIKITFKGLWQLYQICKEKGKKF